MEGRALDRWAFAAWPRSRLAVEEGCITPLCLHFLSVTRDQNPFFQECCVERSRSMLANAWMLSLPGAFVPSYKDASLICLKIARLQVKKRSKIPLKSDFHGDFTQSCMAN